METDADLAAPTATLAGEHLATRSVSKDDGQTIAVTAVNLLVVVPSPS